MQELGERMTAKEFGEWKAWYALEQQHPQAVQLRHAQLLAATMNGPVTRKTGGMFSAAEFMPATPGAESQPDTSTTPASLAAQVAAMNKDFDRGH